MDEAAGWGRNDIVELLIAKGADVNAKFDDDGSTPLHLSAWRGHFETAELLIAAGSEVKAKMEDGFLKDQVQYLLMMNLKNLLN